MAKWWRQRRKDRLRRREIGIALRAEFDLENPRGWAGMRALIRGVGELERARMIARTEALDVRPSSAPAKPRTTTRH